MKYRVCWSIDGKIYKGNPVSKRNAEAWAKHLNKEYPNIYHWIEKDA